MKYFKILFLTTIVLLVMIAMSSLCNAQGNGNPSDSLISFPARFPDGFYIGKSRASYTSEPFWGITSIQIDKGVLRVINFTIRDSSLHETFNEKYEKHFKGNPEYINQCRNDWRGVNLYPVMLNANKNPDKVDLISGATWSYNLFKASVAEALKEAK